MTENEEIKVEMDEGVVEVGGEEELKVKEAQKKQEELIVKQKAAEEEQKKEEDDEKKEASVENEPNETSARKGNHGELEFVKDQDISQYLWDTLLKYMNKGNQKIYNWLMDGVDNGLSKRERGPAKPEAKKEEKIKHTKERGKELYGLRDAVNADFAKGVVANNVASATNIKDKSIQEGFKNLMLRTHKIAYDMTASEFLHEKMSKDKNFDFASMSKEDLDKEINVRTRKKQEMLDMGITATSFYAETIEGKSQQEALNACEEYLNIRENEVNEIKKLVTKDLDDGNFTANDKRPNRDIGVKINAYNQSFAKDASIVPESLKEAISLVENTNLSAEEKISLQEFQKKANLFQSFEANSVLNLQKQIKAVDEAYKANKNNPLRARIAAMKSAKGLNPVSVKMAQKYANNAILRAATNKSGGRK